MPESEPSVSPELPVLPGPPAPASWWRRRIITPLLNLLRQGLSPAQLSLTVALGVIFGLVPTLGVTTLMCSVAAVRLRLNVAALLLVSHLLSPVQLLLIIPAMHAGAQLLGGSTGPELTLAQLQHLFAHDWLAALHLLWHAMLGALLLWAGAAVPVGLALNFGLRPVFRLLLARQKGN